MNKVQYNTLKHQSDIFIALDYPTKQMALAFLESIKANQCHLKVGLEMFTRLGPQWIEQLISQGFQIFLDLKCYDIPQTVANTMKSIAEMGVAMTTLHASGGQAMMLAAREAVNAYPKSAQPLLMAVTILTSFSESEIQSLWGENIHLESMAMTLAQQAEQSGMDGIICSAQEATIIREHCGKDFIIATPGIRLQQSEDDQKRVATPNEARANGADFLVIGRPITQSEHPQLVLEQCL